MAKEYIKAVILEHKKDTHVCFEYIINSNEKASDDGEPQGTAGVPILDVLKKQKLENVLAIVVRYFGGIKLGAGGLVRAYSETAATVVEKSELADLLKVKHCKTTLNYGEETMLNLLKNNEHVYNVKVDYVDKMEITFDVENGYQLKEFEVVELDEKLIRV